MPGALWTAYTHKCQALTSGMKCTQTTLTAISLGKVLTNCFKWTASQPETTSATTTAPCASSTPSCRTLINVTWTKPWKHEWRQKPVSSVPGIISNLWPVSARLTYSRMYQNTMLPKYAAIPKKMYKPMYWRNWRKSPNSYRMNTMATNSMKQDVSPVQLPCLYVHVPHSISGTIQKRKNQPD